MKSEIMKLFLVLLTTFFFSNAYAEATCVSKEEILEKLKEGIPAPQVFDWVKSQCLGSPETTSDGGVVLTKLQHYHLLDCRAHGSVQPHGYGPRSVQVRIVEDNLDLDATVSYQDCSSSDEKTLPYAPLPKFHQDFYKLQTERTKGIPWTTLSMSVPYEEFATDRSLARFRIPLKRFFSEENYNAFHNYQLVIQEIFLKGGFDRRRSQLIGWGYVGLTFSFIKQKDGSTAVKVLAIQKH